MMQGAHRLHLSHTATEAVLPPCHHLSPSRHLQPPPSLPPREFFPVPCHQDEDYPLQDFHILAPLQVKSQG